MLKRTTEDIIEIGSRLIAIKDRLEHGQFERWVEAEFPDMGRSTSKRLMQVAEQFKSVTVTHLPIQSSALYILASPSTPDEARHEAVTRAEAGETITTALVLPDF